MVTVIDKRGIPLTHTFEDLAIGECFQDTADQFCMKIGWDRSMRYVDGKWLPSTFSDRQELIIPLKTTIIVERES